MTLSWTSNPRLALSHPLLAPFPAFTANGYVYEVDFDMFAKKQQVCFTLETLSLCLVFVILTYPFSPSSNPHTGAATDSSAATAASDRYALP